MKLWDKGITINEAIEEFTIGRDKELDILLAPFDVLGSIAHISMLKKVGLLQENELSELHQELIRVYHEIESGSFVIEHGVEDVHSQVEQILVQRLGDVGKKIHSARSRNDQVLLDIKLFSRAKTRELVNSVETLFHTLIQLSGQHKDVLLPGYTHLQVAMPSSFGLWFGAYAESLTDDLQVLLAAFRLINQNPLGSAAGYGSSFPIDRQMVTDLLGFDNLNYNVVYAQMGRGKVEKNVAFAMANVASTISRMAYDLCLFMSQNFGFVSLPDEFTTGSSIMPHKKNPDVFELLRAKCNKIQALANELNFISNNLPSGYFRDMQVIKESFLESFDYLIDCVDIAAFIIEKIKVNPNSINKDIYQYLFSVEEVNKEVLSGIPFREAYKKIGLQIENGTFDPSKSIHHTHEGSIGNLCNDKIEQKFEAILNQFSFAAIEHKENILLMKE
jgi:argininosuccinate lyase